MKTSKSIIKFWLPTLMNRTELAVSNHCAAVGNNIPDIIWVNMDGSSPEATDEAAAAIGPKPLLLLPFKLSGGLCWPSLACFVPFLHR